MKKHISVVAAVSLLFTIFGAAPATSADPDLSESTEERQNDVSLVSDSTVDVMNFAASFEVIDGSGDLVTEVSAIVWSENELDSGNGTDDREQIFSEDLTNGTFDFDFEDGIYEVLIFPYGENSDSLQTRFYLNVSNSLVSQFTREDGENVSQSGGAYQLELLAPNFSGQLLNPVGNTQNPDGETVLTDYESGIYYHGQLQRVEGDQFSYAGQGFQVSEDGTFEGRVSEPGEYVLLFEPYGRTDVAPTRSEKFTVVDTTTQIGPLTVRLVTPMIVLQAKGPTGDEIVPNVSIELFDESTQNFEYHSLGSNGTVALAFDFEAEYTVTVRPPWSSIEFVKTEYQMEVKDNGSGLVASVTGLNDEADGSYVLRLEAPTISGTVSNPSGNESMAFAEILPIKQGMDYPDWEQAGYTNSEGRFALGLSEGTYEIYAKAPYDSGKYGDGVPIGPIVVDSQGGVTVPDGQDANDFDLRLSNPTWSGRVLSPIDNSPVERASICFEPSSFSYNNNCSSTNEDGEFALTAPEDFDGFDSGSRLTVEQWDSNELSAVTFQGKDEMETLFGTWSEGNTYTGIEIFLALPNFEITVTAGGEPAVNVWVSAETADYEHLGGKSTDANGVARLRLDDDQASDEIRIRTDLWNNPDLQLDYTSTDVLLAPGSLSTNSDGVYTADVALKTPNFSGVVETPSSERIRYGGFQIRNLDTDFNDWGNVNRDGAFAENLEQPESGTTTYEIKVDPPYEGVEPLSRTTFYVEIDDTGGVTVFDDTETTEVVSETITVQGSDIQGYKLVLNEANVTGTVVEETETDGATSNVSNSWVESRTAQGQYLWEKSTNSKFDGSFAMDLEDGSYELIANAPWNSSKVRSAACEITVASGSVDSIGTTCDSSGEIELKLREGNLQLDLTDASGTPLRNAHVGVSAGNWYAWAQSDRTGKASLFIDVDEIKAQNNMTSGSSDIEFNFNFDPPWGNSDTVRWSCSTADTGIDVPQICQDLDAISHSDTEFTQTNLTVAYPEPNTVLTVTDGDDNPVSEGAWVQLYRIVTDTGFSYESWVGGASTGPDGTASFNLDLDDTAEYVIRVSPPWDQSRDLSNAKYTETDVQDINGSSYALATPNLSVTALDADGAAARWAWIAVEVVDPAADYSFVDWQSGASVDRSGRTALSLEPDKTYKLTLYPGSQSVGARTSCYVSTDSAGVVTPIDGKCATGTITDGHLDMSLSGGNFIGVIGSGTDADGLIPVAGAIVYANRTVNGDLIEVDAVTDKSGKFALELEAGDWDIYVFSSEESFAGLVLNDYTIDTDSETIQSEDIDLAL